MAKDSAARIELGRSFQQEGTVNEIIHESDFVPLWDGTIRPQSHRMHFLQWEAPFLNCFLLAVSILHAVYVPRASRIFAGMLGAPEVE